MAEIKNTFSQGKMNKDLDERLVPNGQYRDAMNIQVSTSEQSEVGAAQNILGNIRVENEIDNTFVNPSCIGSIADEKNDVLYWFIFSDNKDIILEYKLDGTTTPVFVDTNKNVLNFSANNLITGINIVDDILMWTDNESEPKKINIKRSKQGTVNNDTHTKLVVNETITNVEVVEKHITVIKKRPTLSPIIKINPPAGQNEILANCDFTQGSTSVSNTNTAGHPFDHGGDGINLVGTGDISYVRINRTASGFGPNTSVEIIGELGDAPVQPTNLITPPTDFTGSNSNIGEFNLDPTTLDNFTFYNYDDTDPSGNAPNGAGPDFLHDSTQGHLVWDKVDPFTSHTDNTQAYFRFKMFSDPDNGPYNHPDERSYVEGDQITVTFDFNLDNPSGDTNDRTITVGLLDYSTGAGPGQVPFFGNNWIELDKHDFVITPGLTTGYTYTFTVPSTHSGGLIRLAFYNGGNNIIGETGGGVATWMDNLVIQHTAELGPLPSNFYTAGNHIIVDNAVNANAGDLVTMPGFPQGTHILTTQAFGNNQTRLHLSSGPDPGFYTPIPENSYTQGAAGSNDAFFTNANFANFESTASYVVGDALLLSQVNTPGSLPTNFEVRCTIVDIFDQIGTPGFTEYQVEVESIDISVPNNAAEFDTPPNPNVPGLAFKTTAGVFMNAISELEGSRLFEDKFVRFATRWKYEDGEYSAFSPFSEVAFNASSFSFHPTKNTYNLGMQNNCETIDLLNIVTPDIPEDVVQIDILFKKEDSTSIYSLDSIKPNDPIPTGETNNYWNQNSAPSVEIYDSNNLVNNLPSINSISLPTSYMGKYIVSTENIYAALPANQFLRPWDNVPKKALAQEITGNRLVYGNYTQGYNMVDVNNNVVKPEIITSYRQRSYLDNDIVDFSNGQKSLKTFRTYQVGVVYGDEYGRETPVFTSRDASIKIPYDADNTPEFNGNASRSIQLSPMLVGTQPAFAKYYKFFIKQNSGEYYNLSMDRVYRAQDDENMWISFPSSDINKVQKEDYLVLKKQANQELQVPINNKFKVVDIKAEAPDYIKFKMIDIGYVASPSTLFTGYSTGVNIPQAGEDQLIIFKEVWTDNGGTGNLHEETDKLGLEFSINVGGNTMFSERYEILSIEEVDETTSDPKYRIKLNKVITTTDDFGHTTGLINSSLKLKILKLIPKDSGEFEGRFFVKIISDAITSAYLEPLINELTSYKITSSLPAYYFADDQADYDSGEDHRDGVANSSEAYTENTKTLHGLEKSDTIGAWTNLLDFGTAQLASGFFIDRTFMAAGQPIDPADPSGQTGATRADWSGGTWKGSSSVNASSVVDSIEGAINIDGVSSYTGSRKWRNSNGGSSWDDTYEPSDPNNPSTFYLHLSFGPVGNNLHNGNFSGPMNSQYMNWQGIDRGDFGHGARPLTVGSGVTQTSVDNHNSQWEIKNVNQKAIADKIIPGAKFKFLGSNEVFTINKVRVKRLYNHTAFNERIKVFDGNNLVNPSNLVASPSVEYWYNLWGSTTPTAFSSGSGNAAVYRDGLKDAIVTFGHKTNRRLLYVIELDKDPTDPQFNTGIYSTPDVDDFLNIRFVKETTAEGETDSAITPAIWETEQKDDVDLDIYYEASGAIPISLDKNKQTSEIYAPIGSRVWCNKSNSMPDFPGNAEGLSLIITNWEANTSNGTYNIVEIASPGLNVDTSVAFTNDSAGLSAQTSKYQNRYIRFFREDGSYVTSRIFSVVEITGHYITKVSLMFQTHGYGRKIGLPYYDCFSFGNGVESSRIRDDFNSMVINKGVKASAVIEQQYKEENRKNGLIYSGIYNSTSGVNNLNQFIQAEKITKDLNPTYGSIQKLFQRRINLVSFCEDRVVKILAFKDALFNADGNSQLVATNKVLGEANPFVGDYGISKNPESFAKESYRAYFADKQRGSVLRLSMDGITPISSAGMSDFFKDNLVNSEVILGSYDDRKNNYNITLKSELQNLNRGSGSLENDTEGLTLSYNENVKGWISFKSFIPDTGLSMGNNYFTTFNGQLFQHHIEEDQQNRNNFYGVQAPSTITAVLNMQPDMVKSFNTLNYEGNPGWRSNFIRTNMQTGTVNEFIRKEDKWFNYIIGRQQDIDVNALNFQGLGVAIQIDENI
tara:strand:- start:4511 stop:10867 length:6357 start_codon:yes stop_codon:yes gene_type:complete